MRTRCQAEGKPGTGAARPCNFVAPFLSTGGAALSRDSSGQVCLRSPRKSRSRKRGVNASALDRSVGVIRRGRAFSSLAGWESLTLHQALGAD